MRAVMVSIWRLAVMAILNCSTGPVDGNRPAGMDENGADRLVAAGGKCGFKDGALFLSFYVERKQARFQ